jgi:hypothetical protein
MRYDIFYFSDSYLSYSFSVDVADEDQLAQYLVAKWILKNETDFLKKIGDETDPKTIMKILRTYNNDDAISCIIVKETDSCHKTFEDYISAEGGWHMFQPAGWNVPDESELIELKNAHTSFLKFYYHPTSAIIWLKVYSTDSIKCFIKINEASVLNEHDLLKQIEDLGY